jgi:hypothetical protein
MVTCSICGVYLQGTEEGISITESSSFGNLRSKDERKFHLCERHSREARRHLVGYMRELMERALSLETDFRPSCTICKEPVYGVERFCIAGYSFRDECELVLCKEHYVEVKNRVDEIKEELLDIIGHPWLFIEQEKRYL